MPKYSIQITLHEFDFLRHFANLESETFGNAYQSALKAGYSESYARVILRNYPVFRRKWLKKAMEDEDLVRVIEATRNIDLGEDIKTHEQLSRHIRKQERELIGMNAEELMRELDELLGWGI